MKRSLFIIKNILLIFVGTFMIHLVLELLFPIELILLKNYIYSSLGMEKRIDLSAFGKKESVDYGYIGHSNLKDFSLEGYDGRLHKYQVKGKSLVLQDQKFLFVRTPLVKVGVILFPDLLFVSKTKMKIQCNAKQAKFYYKESKLVLNGLIVCTREGETFLPVGVELDTRSPSLYIREKEKQQHYY